MELSDPCCCTSLQKGMKIIAIIDIATSSICTGLIIILLLLITFDWQDLVPLAAEPDECVVYQDFISLGPAVASIMLLLKLTLSISYIFLGRYLLHGVKEMSYHKIHRWYMICFSLLIIGLAYDVFGILVSMQFCWNFFTSGIVGVAYQAYALWVASAFKKELKRNGETDKLKDYPTIIVTSYHSNSSVQ